MQRADQNSEIILVKQIKNNGRLREPNHEKVRQIAASVRDVGLLHPLIISCDFYLIAGVHRLEAIKLLGIEQVECRVLPFTHDSPELMLFAVDENLARNELTVLEQAEYLLKRENLLAQISRRVNRGAQVGYENAVGENEKRWTQNTDYLTPRDFVHETGLEEALIKRRLQIVKNITEEQRSLIHGTPLANELKELLEIARIKDPDRRTAVIQLMTSQRPPQTVNEAIRKYRISTGEISSDLDVIKPSNWWTFGRPKWQQDGFSGSIPGEVYANSLYYFAPDTGKAADGMAGSGMLRRVYEDKVQWQQGRNLNLEILLYDLYPKEPFASRYGIRRHDMTTPLPEPVDWLIIDPPYFSIASDLFQGELARTKDYARYCEIMSQVIIGAWHSINPDGRFLLLTTPYLDMSNSKNNPIDVPGDLRGIAQKIGFKQLMRVYVSRGEQQRRAAGMMNLKAKASRRMFSDVCELLIFTKEDTYGK